MPIGVRCDWIGREICGAEVDAEEAGEVGRRTASAHARRELFHIDRRRVCRARFVRRRTTPQRLFKGIHHKGTKEAARRATKDSRTSEKPRTASGGHSYLAVLCGSSCGSLCLCGESCLSAAVWCVGARSVLDTPYAGHGSSELPLAPTRTTRIVGNRSPPSIGCPASTTTRSPAFTAPAANASFTAVAMRSPPAAVGVIRTP